MTPANVNLSIIQGATFRKRLVWKSVASTPTAALSGAGAGALSNGIYGYRVTFLSACGESAAVPECSGTTIADATVDGRIALTGIPVGGASVLGRRIYRTAANGQVFKLLTTLTNNTATTYNDNTADSALGATYAPVTGAEGAYTPVNLTGYTARMDIRLKLGDTAVVLTLTTENARITVSALGEINLFIADTDTALLVFKKAVYDLELKAPAGDVTRLLKGDVTLDFEVTRG